MSEFNITLEQQPSLNQAPVSNNNRFLNEENTSRHAVNYATATGPNPKLRPAISSGSVHKPQSFVQDDMVLLNNAR